MEPTSSSNVVVIICVYNEADRLEKTLTALQQTFQGARIVVGDDGSVDGSADIARACNVEVVRTERRLGKGGIATLAAEHVLTEVGVDAVAAEESLSSLRLSKSVASGVQSRLSGRVAGSTGPAIALQSDPSASQQPIFVLCDGDLGDSAGHLAPLVDVVANRHADLAVAKFAQKVGGGFGIAVRFSRWAILKRTGVLTTAPISGQRALSLNALCVALPFARGFGMEVGMTTDVARTGLSVAEVELPLTHRSTGKTWRGFVHRGRQLLHIASAFLRYR